MYQKYDSKKFFVYGQLLLLALSAGAIFRLVYVRTNLQEPLIQVLQITMEELNALYSWLGLSIVLSYLPSGWLADRFSSKHLIIIALILTALLSWALSWLPPYQIARWIYGGLGITSVFIFWSAHMRSARLLSDESNSGKIFGILDGARGGSEALLATIAILIFQVIVHAHEASWQATQEAMQWVFRFFSLVQIGLAILITLFLQNDSRMPSHKVSQTLQDVMPSLRIIPRKIQWQILFMSTAIFSGYTLFFTGFSFYSLLQERFDTTTSSVAWVISIMLWMRLIGAVVGGFLADKMHKVNLLQLAMVISMIGIFLLLVMPLPVMVSYMVVIFIGLSNAVIRGVYWSLIAYIQIPESYLGRVIGFVSFVGYLPDLLLPLLSIYLFRYWSEVQANTIYLWISLGVGLLGLVGLHAFHKITHQE